MPALPLYKDITKKSNDLLNKEYPTETKIDFNRKTQQNGSVEGNVVFKGDGPQFTILPKYNFSINNSPAAVNLEVSTRKDAKVEFTLEPKHAPGLKTITSFGFKEGEEIVPTISAEYRTSHATINSSFEYRSKGSTSKSSSVFGIYPGFNLGLFAEYFLGKTEQTFRELAVTGTYTTPQFEIGAFSRLNNRKDPKKAANKDYKIPKTEIGLNYFHNFNKNYALAAEAVFDATNNEERPKLAIATQFKPDESNIFKIKVDANGRVTGSVQQKLNNTTKLTLSTSTDTNKFTQLSLSDAANVGVSLSFTD